MTEERIGQLMAVAPGNVARLSCFTNFCECCKMTKPTFIHKIDGSDEIFASSAAGAIAMCSDCMTSAALVDVTFYMFHKVVPVEPNQAVNVPRTRGGHSVGYIKGDILRLIEGSTPMLVVPLGFMEDGMPYEKCIPLSVFKDANPGLELDLRSISLDVDEDQAVVDHFSTLWKVYCGSVCLLGHGVVKQ